MREDPAPARLDAIATLPVFLKLAGKRAVLAGGSAPAAWKAELLAAAGARVEVYADQPSEPMQRLVRDMGEAVRLVSRPWEPDDLLGAAVALGAIEDDEEAARFRAAARAAGVPVNVIDKPAFCDFQFGTVVSRSPLLVGISTDGAAPVLGQAIRARIEALLPPSLTAWAGAARDWRPAVQARGFGFRARRRFWEAFASLALRPDAPAPVDDDLAACLDAATAEVAAKPAHVTLIGAGSGGSAGLTLGAVAALQDADVVFHGEDVAGEVVGFARREAEKVAMARAAPSAVAVRRVTDGAGPGQRLAWLDHGDPLTCLVWQARTESLAGVAVTVSRVEGLGRCLACAPPCPAWKAAS